MLLLVACGNNDPAPPDMSRPAAGDAAVEGYPPGPYGVSNGSVIADIAWDGWKDPVAVDYDSAAFEEVFLSDFYDPDGSKGFKAIVLNASARWCSICKIEQNHIREKTLEWEPKGVVFIEALFEDTGGNPAKPTDLVAWGKSYKIDWILVLDPTNKLSPFFDPSASPMNMVIDARTMVIRDIVTGLPEDSWWNTHLGALTEE